MPLADVNRCGMAGSSGRARDVIQCSISLLINQSN